ncbi:MAG: hypothetical protein RSH52_20695, partial [Janthinobacterium sp.]
MAGGGIKVNTEAHSVEKQRFQAVHSSRLTVHLKNLPASVFFSTLTFSLMSRKIGMRTIQKAGLLLCLYGAAVQAYADTDQAVEPSGQ